MSRLTWSVAAVTTESEALFDGFPNSRDSTRLSNGTLQVAVALRLCRPVAVQGVCVCGSVLDRK